MSQRQKIYDFMSHFPDSTFIIPDFMHDPCFIGYKAGTRMNELTREGKVKVVGREGRFTLYQVVKQCECKQKKENVILGFLRRFFS